MQYVMPFSFSRPPLNQNQRLHWSVKARIVKRVRHEACVRAKAARIPKCRHIKIQFYYQPRDSRRRDSANIISSQKPIVDGLVDAGVIPDDTPQFVTETIPIILPPERGKPGKTWLVIDCQE